MDNKYRCHCKQYKEKFEEIIIHQVTDHENQILQYFKREHDGIKNYYRRKIVPACIPAQISQVGKEITVDSEKETIVFCSVHKDENILKKIAVSAEEKELEEAIEEEMKVPIGNFIVHCMVMDYFLITAHEVGLYYFHLWHVSVCACVCLCVSVSLCANFGKNYCTNRHQNFFVSQNFSSHHTY